MEIVDARRLATNFTPPFTNIGRYDRPTLTVRDAKGDFVCSTFCALGFTLDQLHERARWIANALNKQEGE